MPDNIHLFNQPLVRRIAIIVGDDLHPRRIAVEDVLQPFGDEAGVIPLVVVQDKYAGRGGGSSTGIDQNDVAVDQRWRHAVAFHMHDLLTHKQSSPAMPGWQ